VFTSLELYIHNNFAVLHLELFPTRDLQIILSGTAETENLGNKRRSYVKNLKEKSCNGYKGQGLLT
jgi:hypothetical protein